MFAVTNITTFKQNLMMTFSNILERNVNILIHIDVLSEPTVGNIQIEKNKL